MEEKKNNPRVRLAITQGDINGVGYEVILKTFSDNRMFDVCTPVLYGSTKVASYHKKLLALHQDITFNGIHDASEAVDRKFNVVNLTNEEIKIDMGKLTDVAGAQSRQNLKRPSPFAFCFPIFPIEKKGKICAFLQKDDTPSAS